MSPVVSVVIPCFNAARWIAETLESVKSQNLEDVEVIAVNDGSNDDTARIIRECFSFVRLTETENRGVSQTRNLGTRLANGRFIQFLDADDLLAPGKLAKQIAALNETGADVAYGDWNRLEPNGEGTFRLGSTVRRELGQSPEIALFTDFWCPLAAYLFRREIVERVGTWNTSLPVIQDARFTLDCALQGAAFTYVPGIAASYRVHRSNSVSTRSSGAGLKCQFRNGQEVEKWWSEHGGISGSKRQALIKVYGQVARASYETDRPLFFEVCEALERVDPNYVPKSPKALQLLSRVIGYCRAESVALNYRRAKRRLLA